MIDQQLAAGIDAVPVEQARLRPEPEVAEQPWRASSDRIVNANWVFRPLSVHDLVAAFVAGCN